MNKVDKGNENAAKLASTIVKPVETHSQLNVT
jgi:hypothetical protein